MTTENLSLEEKELVAVGASVGAGCHPCVDHHLKAGATAGLAGDRLLAAVTSAERVSAEAAVLMGDHVRGRLGPAVVEPALLSRLEEALASLGAALGTNDAKNVERQLRTALELGASRSQLRQAIETAHTVQENAARIHLREAERLLDSLAQSAAPAEAEPESGDGCGCGAEHEPAPAEAKAPDTEAKSTKGSGCGPGLPSDAEAASTTTGASAADFAGPMRALFGGAGSGEAGMAAAIAHCRRMFEAALARAAAPAEANEPPAPTEPAGFVEEGGGAAEPRAPGGRLDTAC